MSLPLAFKTQIDTIPNRTPYISANPEKLLHWKDKLGIHDRPRVGLVWSGGFRADQPELWTVNERRNISFAHIPKLNNKDINFYSLQKGEPAESDLKKNLEIYWPQSNFINYADKLVDFSDTAALIMNLDVVISVDTSVAHLAGALGKSVYLLNRYDSCWRWSEKNLYSIWYPSIKKFNSAKPLDWEKSIQQIIEFEYPKLLTS